MSDARIDHECTLETIRQLDACFQRDAELAICTARAWNHGSALFLAERLGPAAAYDIASKSADDIITEAASELAVPVEPAPVRDATYNIALGIFLFGASIGFAAGFALR